MRNIYKMHRYIISASLLGLILFSDPFVNGENTEKLTYSGSFTWEPYFKTDSKTGQLSGQAYDLMQLISKELNLPIERINVPWKRALHKTAKGEIDICLPIYWNSKRAQKFLYSHPFSSDKVRIFTLKNRTFKFKSLNDLISKKGAIPLGASYGDEFDSFAKKHLHLAQFPGGNKPLVRRLKTKMLDYFIASEADMASNINIQNGTIIMLPQTLATTNVHLVMPRDTKHKILLQRINKIIKKYLDQVKNKNK